MKFILRYFLLLAFSNIKFLQPKILGKLGEAMVEFHVWIGLNSKYQLINDATIKLQTGNTSQIDHLLLSPYGIFVIETKNYKGVIRGNAEDKTWKQVLGKNTYELYNPIMQNETHVRVIKGVLQGMNAHPHIHNLVVFTTRSKHKRDWLGFGKKLPENVCYGSAWLKYVKRFKKKVFTNEQLDEIKERLESRIMNKNILTDTRHVINVKLRKFK